MNDKIITCALCGSKMKEWESNNPQPLLEDFNDRVCRDCNDYVTATRFILRGADVETTRHICDVIANVMRMASGLKRGRESWMMNKLEEEE
tara:strand:+ start:250 stop:522 length:273 start_codon:yes stop_codon:yes gene_type:complete